VYHDDKEDYATNEPTLTSNAARIALAAWYVSAGASEGASFETVSGTGPQL
jgi:hypothetical protein